MLDQKEVQQAMYLVFNESDAVRDEFCKEVNQIATELSVPAPVVIAIYGRILFRRLLQAGSMEDLRGYATELVTVLAMLRLTLDQSLGISYGPHPTEERPTT